MDKSFSSQNNFDSILETMFINPSLSNGRNCADTISLNNTINSDDENLYYDTNCIYKQSQINEQNVVKKTLTPEEKKQRRLLKNRESAHKSRIRRKELLERTLNENKILKRQLHSIKLKLRISLCDKCKDKLLPTEEGTKPILSDEPSIIASHLNSVSKRSIVLFTTVTALFCMIMLPNIGLFSHLNSRNRFLNHSINRGQITKNLKEKFSSKLDQKIFITHGDYVSLISEHKFLQRNPFEFFENVGLPYIMKENEMNLIDKEDCPGCMVELSWKNVKEGKYGYKFKLFLNNRSLWEDIEQRKGKSENTTNVYEYELYEVECFTTGVSKHIINMQM